MSGHNSTVRNQCPVGRASRPNRTEQLRYIFNTEPWFFVSVVWIVGLVVGLVGGMWL